MTDILFAVTAPEPEGDLFVPVRFEALRDAGAVGDKTLKSVTVPVEDALAAIDFRFMEIEASRAGSLLILQGNSGSGKSTFLATVGQFRHNVTTLTISPDDDVIGYLSKLPPTETPRIVVIEGREAFNEFQRDTIEAILHAVNGFVRTSPAGKRTLIVWPTNGDVATSTIETVAARIGGTALLGTGERHLIFNGPPPSDFVRIAEGTVSALNNGASLATLGISDETAHALTREAGTIGEYMGLVRRELLKNTSRVRRLLGKERFRLWIVVCADFKHESDVEALTSGPAGKADVLKLIAASDSNVVAELREHPEALGIIGAVLDVRIIYLDVLTALAVAREFGGDELKRQMRSKGMSLPQDSTNPARKRLTSSNLGIFLSGGSLGKMTVGRKQTAQSQPFEKLVSITSANDRLFNRALGEALVAAQLIRSYEAQKNLQTAITLRSDLYCESNGGDAISIEITCRTRTSRAGIAKYVLEKMRQYGKGTGILEIG